MRLRRLLLLLLAARVRGGFVDLLPTDGRLRYEGYAHLTTSAERARGDRSPLGAAGSDIRLTSPGARISFATDARRVQVVLEYHGRAKCTADCPRLADGTCYAKQPCPNQCEVLVEVDGVRTQVAHTSPATGREHKQRDFSGEVQLQLMDQGEPRTRWVEYTLVLPWGAPVDLKRVRAEHAADEPRLPSVLAQPPPPSRPRYVAYGDASTAGWCAPTGYPHMLAELNGWSAVNLGVVQARVTPGHGASVAAQRPDIVTILIGATEWQACATPDITAQLEGLLAAARGSAPAGSAGATPLVVVTPTVSHREGAACKGAAAVKPADHRLQIAAAVAARQSAGDDDVYLVDGVALVPLEYLPDGLHPDARGMREIATNLNAQSEPRLVSNQRPLGRAPRTPRLPTNPKGRREPPFAQSASRSCSTA